MVRSLTSARTGLSMAMLVTLSAVAGAQGGAGGRAGPPMGNPNQPAPAQAAQPRPMMPPPRSPAEMLLRQRDRLQLTDDQAKRLEDLSKTQRDALKPPRANMLRARADLADGEEHENLDAQRSALEKLAKIRIDQEIARRKAMKDARDVLTPDQRDRLPGLMAMRRMGAGGRAGFGRGMAGRGGAGMMRPGMRGQMGMPNGMGGAPPNGNAMRRMPPMRPPVRPDTTSVR